MFAQQHSEILFTESAINKRFNPPPQAAVIHYVDPISVNGGKSQSGRKGRSLVPLLKGMIATDRGNQARGEAGNVTFLAIYPLVVWSPRSAFEQSSVEQKMRLPRFVHLEFVDLDDDLYRKPIWLILRGGHAPASS